MKSTRRTPEGRPGRPENRGRAAAHFILALVAALSGLARATSPARAELPPLIPREALFGAPFRADPRMSPDGARLIYLRPDSSRVMQIWIENVDGSSPWQLTRDPGTRVHELGWAWNNHDVYFLQDHDGDENYHVYLVSAEGGKVRDLTPGTGVKATVLAKERDLPDELVLLMNRTDPSLFEPWKCDLRTGELTLLEKNPGRVESWMADAALRVRGRVLAHDDGGGEFQVRDTLETTWRTVLEFRAADDFRPVGFFHEGRLVYVETNNGTPYRGLYTLSVKLGKLTPVATYPGADVDHVVYNEKSHEVEAVAFNRLRVAWTVPVISVQADWDELARIGPGNLQILGRDWSDLNWLVAYSGDTAGPAYYMYNRPQHLSTPLFASRPRLKQFVLAPTRAMEIRARDGESLPSYLTLPVGVEAKRLPLVVRVHDGPGGRNSWGFDPVNQWLANRGYAVLQVNYRGSDGAGTPVKGTPGGSVLEKMRDDLIDGAKWAEDQGIADRKKVCIMGDGFGGWGVLTALADAPGEFACGVERDGVADLPALLDSLPAADRPFLARRWEPLASEQGAPLDRAALSALSPLRRVDRMKAPLLVAQGADDPRVRPDQSDRLVAALKARGATVEYTLFPGEGRCLTLPQDRLAYASAVEAFLARYLGGRTGAAGFEEHGY